MERLAGVGCGKFDFETGCSCSEAEEGCSSEAGEGCSSEAGEEC